MGKYLLKMLLATATQQTIPYLAATLIELLNKLAQETNPDVDAAVLESVKRFAETAHAEPPNV